jgi:mannose-6-phosphate isomerase-like protein (cupin superfamily)
MEIEMNKIEKTTLIKKNWGTEEIIVNNDKYCAKIMTLVPNGKLSLQWHKHKQETFFVLSGALYLDRFQKDGTKVTDTLIKGELVTILPCQAHSFYNPNIYNVVFLEISTTHKDEDTYRVTKSRIENV